MAFVVASLALVVGLSLLSVSVASAALYTPFTGSLVDTLMTAFTGVTLQLGIAVAVSASTALVFELLALGNVTAPVVVPVVVAYAATHGAIYVASVRITDVQETPFDPDAVRRFGPLRFLTGGRGATAGAAEE